MNKNSEKYGMIKVYKQAKKSTLYIFLVYIQFMNLK